MSILQNVPLTVNFLLVTLFPLILWIAALAVSLSFKPLSGMPKRCLLAGAVLNIIAVLTMMPGRFLGIFLYPDIWDLDTLIFYNTVLQGTATVIGSIGLFLVLWAFRLIFKKRYDENTVTVKPD